MRSASSDAGIVFAPETVALARMLLALAQRGEQGVLYVQTERGAARVAIDRGALLAIAPLWAQDDSLGDILLRSGDLNPARHYAALDDLTRSAASARGPVGRWLLDAELATRGAVAHALRAQLRGRLRALLTSRISNTRFESGEASGTAHALEEPLRIADAVVSCLRSFAAASAASDEALESLELSSLGRYVLDNVALWPEEEALRTLLSRATRGDALRAFFRQHARAKVLIAILEGLGGLKANAGKERGSYGLLVRKRRQIRKGDDAYRLLDLREGASPDEARKALRRFASQLHPDALGPSAPDALRRASTEVMTALIDAERRLREHGALRSAR